MIGLLTLTLIAFLNADNWAVLVAGSDSFSNYRHQSDIFRTYKILTKNGFDPKKIITMAYDDIATSSSNPFPGKVFNEPDGPDVYIGTNNIDYKGMNVTAAKFYAVLKGDSAKAGGKVLQSTPEDNVFIFYNDHGSSGLICFPTGPYAYANEIKEVLDYMYKNNMYKNLLFYVEACYSGSLFNGLLPTDRRIYAITAANERESSYAYYCGISKYRTCLSNEFSHFWENQSEISMKPNYITVGEQFEYVKKNTAMSHVCEYGDVSLKKYFIFDFQGHGNNMFGRHSGPKPSRYRGMSLTNEEAYLSSLRMSAEAEPFGEDAINYQKALQEKYRVQTRTRRLAEAMKVENINDEPRRPENMELYKRAIETYCETFGRFGEFDLVPMTTLIANAINTGSLTDKTFDSFMQLAKLYNNHHE